MIVSDAASTPDAVSIRRPPPSTYLWTADGRIRELRRPVDAERPAPPESGEDPLFAAAG